MKNKNKRFSTYSILFISSLLNYVYSQSNQTICERTKDMYLELNDKTKNVTLDSQHIVYYTNFYDRTCVFSNDGQKFVFDTAFKSDFNIKFGMLIEPKTHFVSKKMGYRMSHVYNRGTKTPSYKYNFSSFFATSNTGINWVKVVDLDTLDVDYYHIVDNFHAIDTQTVILYGREIKFKLKDYEKDNRMHLKDKTVYDFKYYVEVHRGLSIDTWNFNNIQYQNFMFITYDCGKTWKKINTLPKEVIDCNVFDIKSTPEVQYFRNTLDRSEIIEFKKEGDKLLVKNKLGKKYRIQF